LRHDAAALPLFLLLRHTLLRRHAAMMPFFLMISAMLRFFFERAHVLMLFRLMMLAAITLDLLMPFFH